MWGDPTVEKRVIFVGKWRGNVDVLGRVKVATKHICR